MIPFTKALAVLFGSIILAAVIGAGLLCLATPAHAGAPIEVVAWQLQTRMMEIKYELPKGMLTAVIEQETRWRNVAGRQGEIGLAQIKPSTVEMIAPNYYSTQPKMLYTWKSTGPVVARIQAVLAREGYYGLTLDGLFGHGTIGAVRSWQRDHGLVVDGIVGPRTWATLFDEPYPGKTIADALWNPAENIEWAARILVYLRENVSANPMIMLAAYNGGQGHALVRYMKQVERRWHRETKELPAAEAVTPDESIDPVERFLYHGRRRVN